MGGRDGIAGAVPVASRKVVMSLKEVVNRSDSEIYATLVECNMDPDEAVNRLLSQDTFHEVKSKRDKKKETKDTLDSWSQGVGNIQNRKARNGSDYYSGRGGGNKFNSNETGNVQGKLTNRRENGTRNHLAGSSTTSGVLGRQPPSNSYPTNAEIKKVPMGPSDAVSSSSVPSSRYQSPWGQRTMADIVKMGRPLTQNTKLPEALVSSKEIGTKAPFKDEFPSIEKPDMTTKVSVEPTMHTGPFSESDVRTEQVLEDFVTENHPVGYPEADHWSASVSNHNLHNDESGDTLLCDDENNKNSETYQAQRNPIEHNETKDPTASVVTSFQKLSIDNEEEEEDEPVVIIPNHLQIHTPECSHLMFGSFGSGIGSGQASGLTSDSFNEESPEVADTRNAEFYGEEEHLRNPPNEQLSYQIDSNPRNYHSSSDAETEQPPQHENPEPAQENQYKFSSTTDYTFESNQQLNHPTLPSSNTTPQMQSFNTLPNVMDVREQDLQYLPFPYNQSMPTKHTATASSLGGPTISMAEALRAASISGPQSNQQVMPDAALAQQHLPMNPYSQHTLPLGHYANMISYPFMPQSYPYMPSAFQQTYPTNNTYHQSLAAMLPQYKTSNLPQSATAPSPYSFNTSGANSGITYEDLLNSQFKDNNNHLTSYQQQAENPSMWPPQGPNNSRVPSANAYYGFPGHQSQQPPGFRHSQQQPSQQEQQFEGHGYVSPYHSSLDHQNARDAPKQSQQQLWQNNY